MLNSNSLRQLALPLALVISGLSTPVLAQEDPIKFGKVRVADFTPVAADSAAEALVLSRTGAAHP